MENYPKTEIFVHGFSYIICFLCFRMSLTRFLSLECFSGALHRDRIISRVMNIFTAVYLTLVCLPIIALSIYCIFFVDISNTTTFHLIECWVLTSIHAIMLIIEIATANRINRFDTFMLKSAYEQTKAQLERGKIGKGPIGDTALETILTQLANQKEGIDVRRVLIHYRYSELPSPTNEMNLVTFEQAMKTKDPRKIKSYPCSPRSQNIASQKWNHRADEANVSWEDEDQQTQVLRSYRKIGTLSPKKYAKHIKQPSELKLMSGDQSQSDEGSSYSDSHTPQDHIAQKAIDAAIAAQESEEMSSRITLKHPNGDEYSTAFIVPNNHIKLTKLKREINKQRSDCEKIGEQNKVKVKEKKQLEDRIRQLRKEISDLTNIDTNITGSDAVSVGFTEQKGVKATSTRLDWKGEESKQMVDRILNGTMSSGVQTDYWEKVQNRKRSTAAPNYRAKGLTGFEDHSTERQNDRSNGLSSAKAIPRGFSTENDFFGPNRPKPHRFHVQKSYSDVPSETPVTSIENADIFGNVLPSTMGVFRPDEFRVSDEENDLNSRLPDINKKRTGNYLPFEYLPHNNYFRNSDLGNPKTDRSNKSQPRKKIPKPKRAKDRGNKTARSGTPLNLRATKYGNKRYSNPRSNNSIVLYKPDLDITNESLLEKAYKNILPREVEMLADDIEIRRGRPISSRRSSNVKPTDKGFFKQRFKSLEPSQANFNVDAGTPRVTPMERRTKKNKKKSKGKRK